MLFLYNWNNTVSMANFFIVHINKVLVKYLFFKKKKKNRKSLKQDLRSVINNSSNYVKTERNFVVLE